MVQLLKKTTVKWHWFENSTTHATYNTAHHCTIRHASLNNNFPNHAFGKLPGNFPTNRYWEFGACCQGGLFALVPQLSDFGKPDYLGAHLLAAHYLFDPWQASAGTTAVCWQSIHHETPRVWKHEYLPSQDCRTCMYGHAQFPLDRFLLRCCTAVARKNIKRLQAPVDDRWMLVLRDPFGSIWYATNGAAPRKPLRAERGSPFARVLFEDKSDKYCLSPFS